MELYSGAVAVDDRGKVSFVNNFDFKEVKRFYMVENHEVGAVRAWHGHKVEEKYVFVASGSAEILVEDMETGKKTYHVLSAINPQVLHIPAGKYNGSKSLEHNTRIIYFSTSTLEESKEDDFRKDYP